jgi:hypothetical protein
MSDIRLPLFNMCGNELVAAGYRTANIVTAYEDLYRIFGHDWIERQFARRESIVNKGGAFFEMHPLLAGMGTYSTPAILRTLEVAHALRVFEKDPELPSLVAQLRAWDQFDHAWYALRIALRFKLLGFDVTLEPKTRNGKADVLASRTEFAIGVECVTIGQPRGRDEVDAMRLVADDIETRMTPGWVLEVTVKVNLTRGVEKRVRDLVKKVLSGPLPRRAESTVAAVALRLPTEAERAVLSAPVGLDGASGDDEFIRSQWADGWNVCIADRIIADDPHDLHTYDPSNMSRLWMLKIRLHEEDGGRSISPEDEIDQRIFAKLEQISTHPPEWTSAVFLDVPYDLDTLDRERIWKRLAGAQLLRRENLSAVFITQNKWMGRRNYLWCAPMIVPAATRFFPPFLVDALARLEDNLDFAALLRCDAEQTDGA